MAGFCSPGELFRSEPVIRHGGPIIRHGGPIIRRSEIVQERPVNLPWRAGNSPWRTYTVQPATFNFQTVFNTRFISSSEIDNLQNCN
ncbi:hypothetical protein QL285_094024 [Trifolium repens]|nr:hypothetical protein QL285_094024 [Trifolium repens]